MSWERSLDMIVAVCIATLIYFLIELIEVVETTALWGTEVSHSTSKACAPLDENRFPDYRSELCKLRSLK